MRPLLFLEAPGLFIGNAGDAWRILAFSVKSGGFYALLLPLDGVEGARRLLYLLDEECWSEGSLGGKPGC